MFQESTFTYRRGRFPPRKTSSPPPKVETTVATVPEDDAKDEEGDLEIGGDLGADEEEPEETNPFYKGQRLIPNHVFESPSLPIRQQVRIRIMFFSPDVTSLYFSTGYIRIMFSLDVTG